MQGQRCKIRRHVANFLQTNRLETPFLGISIVFRNFHCFAKLRGVEIDEVKLRFKDPCQRDRIMRIENDHCIACGSFEGFFTRVQGQNRRSYLETTAVIGPGTTGAPPGRTDD
jgi:hypothetical protein